MGWVTHPYYMHRVSIHATWGGRSGICLPQVGGWAGGRVGGGVGIKQNSKKYFFYSALQHIGTRQKAKK